VGNGMPEESIAAYVNNIISFAIFIAVITLIFTVLFILSRILIYRNRREHGTGPGGESSTGRPLFLFSCKKDPNQLKNFFILALSFSYVISFILLVLIVFDYAVDRTPGLNMYLIIAILLYFILTVVYVIRSRTIN
jgi:hypothetical protein